MNNTCPSCKSTNTQDASIRENNGIYGPGAASWVVEEKSLCNDCGVYFKPMDRSKEPAIAEMKYAIAKFMGYEKVTVAYADSEEETEWQRNNEEWMSKVGIQLVGDYIVNVAEDKWHNWEDVKYHSSWDWLMPVVLRIKNDESLRLRVPCLGVPDSIWPYINAMKEMNKRLLKADITGTHAGVYQFIQWYNQQKQKDGPQA